VLAELEAADLVDRADQPVGGCAHRPTAPTIEAVDGTSRRTRPPAAATLPSRRHRCEPLAPAPVFDGDGIRLV